MIRDRRWKYVWNLADTDELYDLEADPAELTNLAHVSEYSDKLRQLRLDMLVELKRVGDCTVRSHWLREMLENNRKY